MATVVVIQFPGVNCEYETARILETVGLSARIVRWNDSSSAIHDAAAMIVPGVKRIRVSERIRTSAHSLN